MLDDYDLEDVFAYINPTMLYGKHLGLKGNLETLLEQGDKKARDLDKRVRGLEDEILAKKMLRARGVYKFFPANSNGDEIRIYNSTGTEVMKCFTFHGKRMAKDCV